MLDLGAQVIGALISGLIGAAVALLIFRWQHEADTKTEERAAADRLNLVKAGLAAEVELIAHAIGTLIQQHELLGAPAASAMATLGTFNVRVYPAVLPQLGVLGTPLAHDIITIYATFEHLIDRGREIDAALAKGLRDPEIDRSSAAWFQQAQELHAGIVRQTLPALRAPLSRG